MKFEGNFFHFFQCGPRDLSLSLMRPASHFEFETPVIESERVRFRVSEWREKKKLFIKSSKKPSLKKHFKLISLGNFVRLMQMFSKEEKEKISSHMKTIMLYYNKHFF
jgi:hypothetical protein